MLKPNHVQTKIIWPDSVLKNKTRLSFLLLDKWNFLLFQSQGFNFSICSQISARDVTRNNQPSWDWKNLGFTRGAPKPGLVLVPSGWTLLELQWQSCHVLRWPPSQLQPPETSGANGYAYAFFFPWGKVNQNAGVCVWIKRDQGGSWILLAAVDTPELVVCCDVGPTLKNIESTLEEGGLAAYGRW